MNGRMLLLLGGNRPALDLNFGSGSSPDGRMAFSGGANGTRTDATGSIVSASAPRIDYDPVTLAPLGLLVEESRTNLLLNSTIDGANLATQSVTVTAQAYTLSFYGSGTVTLSGTATGAKVGAGAYPARGKFTFTPTAGTLTLTVTGTVQYAQLEPGAFATSVIPTAGATVTRTLDSASMPVTGIFRAAGTVLVEADCPNATAQAVDKVFWAAYSTSWINNAIHLRTFNIGTFVPQIYNTTTAQLGTTPLQSVNTSAMNKAALSWSASGASLSSNGTAATNQALALVIPSPTTLFLGSSGLGTVALNGHVKRLRIWQRQYADAQLQVLTA